MSQELPDGVEFPSDEQVSALMALVEEYAGDYARATMENLYGTSKGYTKQCFEVANESREAVVSKIRTILADHEQQAARVPEGYALVPVEPTPEMLKAGVTAFQHSYSEADILSDWRACFKAMIAAAPTEPSKPEQADAPSEDREEIEAVIACLGDDAAQLRDENPEDERADNMDKAADLLGRLLATTPPPQAERVPLSDEQCEWTIQDDDYGDTWQSSCGELWSFIDGGPKENRVSFCHHCGKKVGIGTPKEGA